MVGPSELDDGAAGVHEARLSPLGRLLHHQANQQLIHRHLVSRLCRRESQVHGVSHHLDPTCAVLTCSPPLASGSEPTRRLPISPEGGLAPTVCLPSRPSGAEPSPRAPPALAERAACVKTLREALHWSLSSVPLAVGLLPWSAPRWAVQAGCPSGCPPPAPPCDAPAGPTPSTGGRRRSGGWEHPPSPTWPHAGRLGRSPQGPPGAAPPLRQGGLVVRQAVLQFIGSMSTQEAFQNVHRRVSASSLAGII